MSSDQQRFRWAVLGNELAIISSFCVILGGTLGLLQEFGRSHIALYSLVFGVFLFVWEYPRGHQTGAKMMERRFQKFLVPVLSSTGWFSQNYYVRFILYFWLGAPCCFLLPTFIGGVCVMLTSITYLKAAKGGEKWHAPTFLPAVCQTLPKKEPMLDVKSSKPYFEFMKETVC